jgi:hypothetical protein
MKLYLYCVLGDGDLPPASVDGIMGQPLTAIRFDSLSAITSEFDADTVPMNRENVLKHSAVINSVLAHATPLPFRFGTLADETNLRSFMTSRHEAIATRLNLLQGFLEMSVKIIWDPDSSGETAADTGEAESEDGAGAGTVFLKNKQRELSVSNSRVKQAEALSAALDTRIESLAKEKQINLRPNEKLVLAASHLVERRSIPAYREKLAEFGIERPDLRFLVSGPWAPYSFANIDLEFKTHFGVS